MKNVRISLLIHGFAAAHVAVSLLCALAGVQDTLLLTLLTMTLTVVICIRRRLTVEFTAINVILVNILGFILGNLGAQFLHVQNVMLEHAISTFLTTEILGWGLDLLSRSFQPREPGPAGWRTSWQKSLGWLVFAVAFVFVLRVVADFIIKRYMTSEGAVLAMLFGILSNSLNLVLMICLNLIFIRFARKQKYDLYTASAGVTVFIGVVSLLCAAVQTTGLPYGWQPRMERGMFLRNVVLCALVEIMIFAVIYVLVFAATMRSEMERQREKRHRAEFQYLTLKHQVNPHFLFNSLNILDSLVQEGAAEEASEYIHRLSHIYRYLLQHEGDRLVRIEEEAGFAQDYLELLQIRFPDGFLVENVIRNEDRGRLIVPCSLQLLLENATKHNAVSAAEPLRVRLSSDGETLSVENNLIPKVSPISSTGVGLKYIRQQYLDLSGTEVFVEKSADRFLVRLPLL
ncbi:MAG: histidine kinase [Bacteroidales bacterium]|nr:histidine kinase [Bacteroidales bacterium]